MITVHYINHLGNGSNHRQDFNDLEVAYHEALKSSDQYGKVEFHLHHDGSVLGFAEVAKMNEENDQDQLRFMEAEAEFHSRQAAEADAHYAFITRQQRREAQERMSRGDPGAMAELERDWAQEDEDERRFGPGV